MSKDLNNNINVKLDFDEIKEENEEYDLINNYKNDVIPKNLNFLEHMKQSMNNINKNCKCDSTLDKKFYCIPCRISCCDKCTLNEHKSHSIVNKQELNLNSIKLNLLFNEIESIYSIYPTFKNFEKFNQELINSINLKYNDIIIFIEKSRNEKMKEVESVIEHFNKMNLNLKNSINNVKKSVSQFFDNYKSFLNEGKDESNIIFLLKYDFSTEIFKKCFELKTNAKNINDDLIKYEKNTNDKLNILKKEILDIFLKNKEKEEQKLKTIKEKYNQTHNEILLNEERNEFPLLNLEKNIIKVSSELLFDSIQKRIKKYSELIQFFKGNIYNQLQNNKNLNKIEEMIKNYESKNNTNENFFQRTNNTKKQLKSNNNIKEKIGKNIELKLDNPIIMKYFNYLIIETYDKNFKQKIKENQLSHIELISNQPSENQNEKETLSKAIEGKNEIQYYDKVKKKLIKKKLNLTKNPFGYTKFPIGCRTLQIGNKLYISGGRDTIKTYSNVLIYDLKKDHLIRIMDMKYPRYYHTMIYNEFFKTIFVIGGEENNKIEVFDTLNFKWLQLPDLKIPRANSIFYYDKLREEIYVLFGNEGKFSENKNYSEIIEKLSIKNIKEGFKIVNPKNSAEILLKNQLFVFPIEDKGKLLIYGGVEKRKSKRDVCLFDLNKNELLKIDEKILQDLWNFARNDRKLSYIVSTIKLK